MPPCSPCGKFSDKETAEGPLSPMAEVSGTRAQRGRWQLDATAEPYFPFTPVFLHFRPKNPHFGGIVLTFMSRLC